MTDRKRSLSLGVLCEHSEIIQSVSTELLVAELLVSQSLIGSVTVMCLD